MQDDLIKSISYDQEEILEWIIKLYCPDGFECDPTYSKGNFYKSGRIPQPKYKFDIEPQTSDTYKVNCTELYKHIKDSGIEKFKSIIFDPPFLATTGKSLKDSNSNNNILAKRFGVYKNMKELYSLYSQAIKVLSWCLYKNGFLVVKCQDTVLSGKQNLSHYLVIKYALKNGLYPKDLFVLLAKNRIVADWQRNQKHARKFHSYFIVFQNKNVNMAYAY